jgi:hypothetical protein
MAHKLLILLSAALFASCLPLEAFCVSGSCSNWPGYGILLFGLLPLWATPANMTWLANPMLFGAWVAVLLGAKKSSLCLSFSALAVSAAFLFMKTVVTNEAGIASPITGLRLGYWLWLASMAAAVAAALTTLASSPATMAKRP